MSQDFATTCVHCETSQWIAVAYLGRKVKCASCHLQFVARENAPSRSGADTPTINVGCLQCGAAQTCGQEFVNKKIKCGNCGAVFLAIPANLPAVPQVVAQAGAQPKKTEAGRSAFMTFVQSPQGMGILSTSVVLLAAFCALFFGWLQPQQQAAARWNELWQTADNHFRAGRFAAAAASYQDLLAHTEISSVKSEPDRELVQIMQPWSQTLADLDRTVEQDISPDVGDSNASATKPNAPLAEMTRFVKQLLPIQNDLKKFAARFEETKTISDSTVDFRFGYSTQQRWQDSVDWLGHRFAKRVEIWMSGNRPRLELALVWEPVKQFLDREAPPTPQTATEYSVILKDAQFERGLADFRQSAAAVEKTPTRSALLAARAQWQRLAERYATYTAKEQPVWNDFTGRVRQALLRELRAEAASQKVTPPGTFSRRGPAEFPAADYARLATTNGGGAAIVGRVFAIAQDRCLEINAATGRVVGGWRVGFDLAWIPQPLEIEGHSFLAISWQEGAVQALTLLDAQRNSAWTWELPADQRFLGPPLVVDDQLFAILETGELWQFEWTLEGAQPRRRLQLPESIPGGTISRPDQRGFIAVGQSFALYAVSLSSPPRLEDVIPLPTGVQFPEPQGVWAPPYLVLAHRLGEGKSELRTWLQQGSEWHAASPLGMTGTSYQAPIVLGSQMLVLTDEAESVFLFQSQKEAPVAGLFEDKKGASAVSSRPYGFALADAFLVASQAGLQCYTIDPLATKAGRKRDLRWEHRWQSAENTPTQPLQVVNNHVAAVVQHPDSMGITVDLVAAATGQLVWRTRIAAKGTNVWLPGSRDLVDGIAILQDDAANWFNLRSKAEEVEARLLEHPPVPAAASWSAANSVWWWADAVARKMFCGSANGTIQPYFELFETPASPISVRDAPSSLLAWVTEAQNVAVCHPTRDGRPITIPLERGVPAQDWFQPLWLSTNVVLCGHPAGFLARVEVDEHNEQLKLSLIQRALGDSLTTENGTFAAVAADGNLVIATSAELVLLDCETLRLRTRLPLPASASTSPVGRTPLGIGLQNGTLVLYDPAISSRKRLVRLFTVPVVSLVAHAKDKLLYAVSASGEIATVGQDGNVLRRWTASAPLALPPFFCGRQLLVATEAGSLEIFNRHEG